MMHTALLFIVFMLLVACSSQPTQQQAKRSGASPAVDKQIATTQAIKKDSAEVLLIDANSVIVADQTQQQKTQTIAVLLPFSAPRKSFLRKVSTAIRVGLLYKLYEVSSNLKVHFVDTYNTDIVAAYGRAKELGATIIFGPLLPNKVAKLGLSKPDIPVVAFNTFDARAEVPEHWHTLSLSLTQEVTQAAQDIANAGYTQAFVLYVDNNNWAYKAAMTFESAWLATGGDIANTQPISRSQSLSKSVSDLVGITNQDIQSYSKYLKQKRNAEQIATRDDTPFVDPLDSLSVEERKAFIANVTRKFPGEFVYLIASSDEGRQIKPLLAFHLSNDLQIFATSKMYSDTLNERIRRDFHATLFTDTPWMISHVYKQHRKKLHTLWPAIHPIYSRFYALGYDVLPIVRLLDVHAQNAKGSFFVAGATGLLSLDVSGRIQRQVSWGLFAGEKVVELSDIPLYAPPTEKWDEAWQHEENDAIRLP